MNILLRRRKLGNGSCRGIQAVSTTGLTMLRNDSPFPDNVSIVFRWGCTSNLPEGVKVVNTAKSIHWCSDKRQGRLDMQEAGVSVPKTWTDFSAVTSYPVVVRPDRHAQGRRLYTAGDATDLQVILQEHFNGGTGDCFYISELINKVAEYRVMVVQNRVAWVARKTPADPSAIAWNVALGGRFDNVRWGDWPMAVIKEALAAAKVSGCDFCGVDVMVDADGKAYVLEVNSAPSQTSAYRQACVAKCFDYIVTKGKDHFKEPERVRSWKDVIHSSIWSRSNA